MTPRKREHCDKLTDDEIERRFDELIVPAIDEIVQREIEHPTPIPPEPKKKKGE